MQTTNVKLYSLSYSQAKTYMLAILFVAGNIILPQICHLVPQGGVRWLPIYFFTLVGAYKYGWRVGLLTALVSPCINSLLFGMPAPTVLPAILVKSTVLALAASYAAQRFKQASLLMLAAVVLTYQLLGGVAEWIMMDNINYALQDFRIGLPGMLTQIFGGWLVINKLMNR